ncbi:hypothetical protein KUTeg_014366 [Tegillarca granosa]|uniref:Uncharacterized protein n=1 Tax=Tegillarca granosa TaxID=220873 RepID=A0ABQ9F0T2_TEGGR|nr:hypothetical protein KUTeg_014366 [Tegillarca granosa]
MADEILKNLCSSVKLERDRGYQKLTDFLKRLDLEGLFQLELEIIKLLDDNDASWETRHGALMGAKAILINGNASDDFVVELRVKTVKFLDDAEFRVRIAAGEVLGALCRKVGPEIYSSFRSAILEGIKSNLDRDSLHETTEQQQTELLLEKLGSSPGKDRPHGADAAQIFHDTAGWKSLETWMKCLQSVVEGCGHLFNQYVDQELLDLIFIALLHTNRFVRETGYYVCSTLVSIGKPKEGMEALSLEEENAVYRHGKQFSQHLGKGLADNWSQVRLAASVATRQFLKSIPTDAAKEQFYPFLIPRMCLNRYYVAEGVRIYSQDTWRQVTGGEGKVLVAKYIKEVVDYYIEATDADNHAVREAACACIAELGSKIDKNVVCPFIPRLLEALLICFNDDSWPVRDAACVACGNFVMCFPEESRIFWFIGAESLETVLAKIKEGLEGVEQQPASSDKYHDLDKAPATYGVVKKLRDNDMELHTDKQMYSCGSLAPKMGRGGGCMDHKFRKEPEPWELADGCVHLLAEMSNHQDLVQHVSQMLPLLAKSASYHHYTHHVCYMETLCKQSCDNALTSSAASQCLNQLSGFLGPNILKGRVEQYNPM